MSYIYIYDISSLRVKIIRCGRMTQTFVHWNSNEVMSWGEESLKQNTLAGFCELGNEPRI